MSEEERRRSLRPLPPASPENASASPATSRTALERRADFQEQHDDSHVTRQVTAANAEFGDGFGRSFVYDGETLFVGANGSVHVPRKEEGGWKPTGVTLMSSDTSTDSNAFGSSLARSEDWLFVGDSRANQPRDRDLRICVA